MSLDERKAQTIVVAGASGFLGQALPGALNSDHHLVGLTRSSTILSAQNSQHSTNSDRGYSWRQADLFSRKQTIDGLRGADLAIYLVHSKRPSAALTQGDVRDMDLICADNFARAARHHGVDDLILISGIPAGDNQLDSPISDPLEVEETLGAYGAQVTTLRTGMVIGAGGDLTEMIFRLVENLPVMALPRWTQTPIRPIFYSDLMELIRYIIENPSCRGRSWNVAGADEVNYQILLQMSADIMGLRRRIYTLPFTSPALSSRWISMFTGLPRTVIRPMIEMLRRPTPVVDAELQQLAGQTPTPITAALVEALEKKDIGGGDELVEAKQSTVLSSIKPPNEVRSVQRLPVPPGRRARWIATTYARWLPEFMAPLMRVEFREERYLEFYMRLLPWPLLSLELDREVSRPDRQLYWIRGGLLAATQERGRLEFREVLDGQWSLAAVHRFRPRLPWFIYILTQARIHLFIMKSFGRYLADERRRCLDHDAP